MDYKKLQEKKRSFEEECTKTKNTLFNSIVEKIRVFGSIKFENPIILDYIFFNDDYLGKDVVTHIFTYKDNILVEYYTDEDALYYADCERSNLSLYNQCVKSLNLLTLEELFKVWEELEKYK